MITTRMFELLDNESLPVCVGSIWGFAKSPSELLTPQQAVRAVLELDPNWDDVRHIDMDIVDHGTNFPPESGPSTYKVSWHNLLVVYNSGRKQQVLVVSTTEQVEIIPGAGDGDAAFAHKVGWQMDVKVPMVSLRVVATVGPI